MLNMWTFYKCIIGCILIASITACNVVNVLKLRYANDHIVPLWKSEHSQMPIKTDYIGEKVFVYGSINGVSGFKFMVDTGASFTYLFDTPKVKALQLPEGYPLNLSGWGDDEDSLGYQTSMNVLSFGSMEVSNFQGAFLQMSKTRYFIDDSELIFDGVIGHDLMRHFVWTFDKKHQQVTLANKPFVANKDTTALPFDTFMSKISVKGTIDFGKEQKTNHDFIIDTGSRNYLKLSSAFIESEEISLPSGRVRGADFGLSGKAEHQRVTLPSLQLGGLTLNKVKTNIIHTDDEDDYWVIGNAMLNQYKTTVDYQTSTLFLAAYEHSPFTSRYNLLGLEVRKLLSGNFIVRYVMPDLPGNVAGFKSGDIITQVNGAPAKNISKEDWLSMSSTPGKYKVCRQSLDCRMLQAKHIVGFSG